MGGLYIRPSMPAIFAAGPQVPAVRSGRIYNTPLQGNRRRAEPSYPGASWGLVSGGHLGRPYEEAGAGRGYSSGGAE